MASPQTGASGRARTVAVNSCYESLHPLRDEPSKLACRQSGWPAITEDPARKFRNFCQYSGALPVSARQLRGNSFHAALQVTSGQVRWNGADLGTGNDASFEEHEITGSARSTDRNAENPGGINIESELTIHRSGNPQWCEFRKVPHGVGKQLDGCEQAVGKQPTFVLDVGPVVRDQGETCLCKCKRQGRLSRARSTGDQQSLLRDGEGGAVYGHNPCGGAENAQ